MFEYKQIIVPSEISTRVYKFKNKLIRAYISNEKSHEFLLLGGVTAKLWEFLLTNPTREDLSDFAKKLKICSELDDFLCELENLGLIKFKSNNNNIPTQTYYNVIEINNYSEAEEKRTLKFYSSMLEWLIKHGFMQRLFIELTYKCNLKCIHCFNDKDDNKKELKFSELKPVIDEAYNLGVFNIVLSGGEATLAKDFLKTAKYIREKRISLEVYTNGQTLYDNPKLLNELINLFPYRISLSLYSLNPDVHDKVTGVKGSQYKTIEVIKKLKENNILVGIKCFLTKYNANEYIELKNFAKNNGLSMSVDCKFVNNPSRNNNNVRVTNKQLLELYTNPKSLLRIKKPLIKYSEDFFNGPLCYAGYMGLAVDPNLGVYCCPTLKIKLGQIGKESLSSIWNSQNTDSPLTKIRGTKHKDLKECWKNEYCKYCIYCPGMAFLENKYNKKYKPFCNDAKCRMKAAMINSKIKKNDKHK